LSDILDFVGLFGVDATERFFQVGLNRFEDIDPTQITLIDIIVINSQVVDPTSTLEIRLAGHPFSIQVTPEPFDSAQHTNFTNLPPVRVALEDGGLIGQLSSSFFATSFTFDYFLLFSTDEASVQVDLGDGLPPTIMSDLSINNGEFSFDAEGTPGTIYQAQTSIDLSADSWMASGPRRIAPSGIFDFNVDVPAGQEG